jgi:hypothetical protein
MKLSDPSYYLPVIQAFSPGKTFSSGTTEPLLIRGVCEQTSLKDDSVLKMMGASRMSIEASARELIGSWVALELGLNVPEPVVVNISPVFVDALRGSQQFGIASNSIGLNFGSRYMTGYQEPLQGQQFSEDLLAQLINVFAFDMLIGNIDRRIGKPNFLVNGNDIMVLDHELAFSFLKELPFLRSKTPWLIREADITWINDNYCFNLLKGKSVDFLNFSEKLDVIDNDFWNKLSVTVPDVWRTDQIDSIKDHLNSIIANKEEFTSELNRILL